MVANSPALTVENLTVALVESGGASELSAMPIAQQLSSTTSFHVVPAHCSGRRRSHQSIIIFTCAASRCLESSVIVHRTHLHRSAILDLRFKMIIFTSCSIEPVRLHAACSFALCRARCLVLGATAVISHVRSYLPNGYVGLTVARAHLPLGPRWGITLLLCAPGGASPTPQQSPGGASLPGAGIARASW